MPSESPGREQGLHTRSYIMYIDAITVQRESHREIKSL